jgi:diacylglycerol kinase family enzyme
MTRLSPDNTSLAPFVTKKSNQLMENVMIFHNPGAGEGESSKAELIGMLEAEGFKCSYSSTKGFRWENLESEGIDLLVVAGGDGTVRKIAGDLLERRVFDKKLPIGLLPMGTANNIAKTLGLSGEASSMIRAWKEGSAKKFDVGKLKGLEKPAYFLESFGYGLFPKLMLEMKKRKKNDIEDPKEKLQAALKLLYKLTLSSPLKNCMLRIDGKDYSGKFLLIEVMNIRSIGPNLHLAPDADPGDGELDVVFITEKQRKGLAAYIKKKIAGEEVIFDFPIIQAKDLKIFWHGKHAHVDDEYHKLKKPVKIKIKLRESVLDFLESA